MSYFDKLAAHSQANVTTENAEGGKTVIICTRDSRISRYIELELREMIADMCVSITILSFDADGKPILPYSPNTAEDHSDVLLIADGDVLIQKDRRLLHKVLSVCEKNRMGVLLFGRGEWTEYFPSGKTCDSFSGAVFLQYPFHTKEMRDVINKFLKTDRSPTHSPCKDGDESPIIDTDRMIVRYRGHSVSLTETEFRLFMCLYENRGKPTPRQKILSDVWGRNGEDTASNIADVYVNYLRAKLRNAKIDIPVMSVRGVGYTLMLD